MLNDKFWEAVIPALLKASRTLNLGETLGIILKASNVAKAATTIALLWGTPIGHHLGRCVGNISFATSIW